MNITTEKLDEFFDELFLLYSKYGISIAHEDFQGNFLISTDSAYNRKWMRDASIWNMD